MTFKLKSGTICVLGVMFLLSGTGSSQTLNGPTIIDATKSLNCELTAAFFDEFVQSTPAEKNIIIVAYRGKLETKDDIVLRRLHNVRTYILEYYKNTKFSRSSERLISTSSLSRSPEGKIDFYVDGSLKLSILFRQNRDLQLSPCYLETSDYCRDDMKRLFYPCLDRKRERKHGQKRTKGQKRTARMGSKQESDRARMG